MDWLDLLAVQATDSQESSPTPQFESINSLALSFLYSPALTSIHDYWKKTVTVYILNEDQQRGNQGTRLPWHPTSQGVRLRGATEGHFPARQGLTKRGPLEKGMANRFGILVLRTQRTQWFP